MSLLMDALDLIWLLIPTGALMLIGVMLAFFRYTQLWQRWQLWALLPLV